MDKKLTLVKKSFVTMVQSVENDSDETTGCLIDYMRCSFTSQISEKK